MTKRLNSVILYDNLISRTGTSFVIFGYNGRDGVVTDDNGLIYMRARYYSPEMKRFINADIIPGKLSNAITLNRFAYANGNPVSFVDPFGLSVWSWLKENLVDPVGNALTTAGNAIVDGAQVAGEFIVDTATTVGNAIVDGAQAAGNFIVDTATTVGNAIVDGAQTAGKFIADTATNVGTAIVNGTKTAANWTNENIIKPTGEALSNAGRQIKDGFVNAAKKIGNSFTNAIEAKVLLGFGLGVSGEDCGAEASKSIVIGIDNGAEYCGHEINAEIGVGVIGFSSTHTHLSEVDYAPVRCDSEHAYERKTVFNILSCPDTIHSNSVNIGPFSIASNGDVSLSLQGSIFAIVGVGGSVGINLSEFFRGVFE